MVWIGFGNFPARTHLPIVVSLTPRACAAAFLVSSVIVRCFASIMFSSGITAGTAPASLIHTGGENGGWRLAPKTRTNAELSFAFPLHLVLAEANYTCEINMLIGSGRSNTLTIG